MRELSVILVNMIAAGTPILYALLGDMVSQRAVGRCGEHDIVKFGVVGRGLDCIHAVRVLCCL